MHSIEGHRGVQKKAASTAWLAVARRSRNDLSIGRDTNAVLVDVAAACKKPAFPIAHQLPASARRKRNAPALKNGRPKHFRCRLTTGNRLSLDLARSTETTNQSWRKRRSLAWDRFPRRQIASGDSATHQLRRRDSKTDADFHPVLSPTTKQASP
ncbi:hypothetical protein [Rhodanobacter sp. BL-MT-08]